MRILSWNLNGVRTIPQYHPWNTFRNWDAILKELQADIICFQEMKSSRATIGRDVALPDSFHSFFSFPAAKGGYSGVAVYTNARTATPLKAEEGLSGGVQPKHPLSPEERISTSYPLARELELVRDADDEIPNDLLSLDLEGRALVLDFGLFVLINLYCPNEGSDARFPYKMNYHLMLQERVRGLIAARREVVVVGDLNVCAAPIDHCDGHLPSNASTFWEHPARAWIRDWLAPRGPLIDLLRKFWPDRKGMYTCWNTKISARETNYGTRIDYVLITPGLLPWVKASDIEPSIKGSDHCPVFVDLHDEITTETGEKRVLRDLMHMSTDAAKREPPRLAAKHWPEFQGKQTLMSSFFVKRAAETSSSSSPPPPPTTVPPNGLSALATAFDALETQLPPPPVLVDVEESSASKAPQPQPPSSSSQADTDTELEPSTPPSPVSPAASQPSLKPPPQEPRESRKRSRTDPPAAGTAKQPKLSAGQTKLSSFFTKPTGAATTTAAAAPTKAPSSSGRAGWCPSSEIIDLCEDSEEMEMPSSLPTITSEIRLPPDSSSSSSQGKGKESDSYSGKAGTGTGTSSWSAFFMPTPPPLCNVHQEPAKEWRVKKPGPNKGKTFFLCSRPVGPGYDRGRSERLREEVDHQYKCNFFMWSNDARREATRASTTAVRGSVAGTRTLS